MVVRLFGSVAVAKVPVQELYVAVENWFKALVTLVGKAATVPEAGAQEASAHESA